MRFSASIPRWRSGVKGDVRNNELRCGSVSRRWRIFLNSTTGSRTSEVNPGPWLAFETAPPSWALAGVNIQQLSKATSVIEMAELRAMSTRLSVGCAWALIPVRALVGVPHLAAKFPERVISGLIRYRLRMTMAAPKPAAHLESLHHESRSRGLRSLYRLFIASTVRFATMARSARAPLGAGLRLGRLRLNPWYLSLGAQIIRRSEPHLRRRRHPGTQIIFGGVTSDRATTHLRTSTIGTDRAGAMFASASMLTICTCYTGRVDFASFV